MENGTYGDIWLGVGREDELMMLDQAFFGAGRRVVCITGAPGVGKSSLAALFGNRRKSLLPGGMYRFAVGPLQSPSELTLGSVPELGVPTLVVWNLDTELPDGVLERNIVRVATARPTAKLLLTSRRPYASKLVDLTIKLEAFSEGALRFMREDVRSRLGESAFRDISARCVKVIH